MIWMSTTMLSDLKGAEILPMSYADHKPVTVTFIDVPKRIRWRLNPFILKSESFFLKAKDEIMEFFQINMRPETKLITSGILLKLMLEEYLFTN